MLRGARHSYLLNPDLVSRPSRLAADAMDSSWARHQQRAHRLTNSQPRPTSATQYGAHERVVEPLGTGMAGQSPPQPVPQGSMEMPTLRLWKRTQMRIWRAHTFKREFAVATIVYSFNYKPYIVFSDLLVVLCASLCNIYTPNVVATRWRRRASGCASLRSGLHRLSRGFLFFGSSP